VREALAGSAPDVVDTAQLLVTELVTNAMLHAGSEVEVRLWARDTRVHVRVSDTVSDRPLIPRALDHDASVGRGLQLVHALAAAHGTEVSESGKTVWFELWPGVRPPPNPAGTWVGAKPDDNVERKPVLLQDVPIGLWRAAQRHSDALLRECKLLVLSGEQLPGMSAEELREAEAAHDLITQAFSADVESAPPDDPTLTITPIRLLLPPTCAHGVRVLAVTLERANAAARAARFLTRPSLPEIAAFRHWLLDQIVTQLDGGAPTPWVSPVAPEARAASAPGQISAAAQMDHSASVIVASDDNVILAVGDAITGLLGWEPAHLVGRRIVTVIPPRLRLSHVTGFTNFLLSGESRIIGTPVAVAALHRDGHEVPVQLLIRVEQSQQGRPLFVATLRPDNE